MDEYIEREALLVRLDGIWDCCDITFPHGRNHICEPFDCKGCKWHDTLEAVKEIVRRFPAADVAPVRHGRWEQHLLPLAWKCSVCRYRTSNRALKYNHMNYCPNCGAKMDAENWK